MCVTLDPDSFQMPQRTVMEALSSLVTSHHVSVGDNCQDIYLHWYSTFLLEMEVEVTGEKDREDTEYSIFLHENN